MLEKPLAFLYKSTLSSNAPPVVTHSFILEKDTGPRLDIKTVFPRYGDSHVKITETVGETVLSLTWESLYW